MLVQPPVALRALLFPRHVLCNAGRASRGVCGRACLVAQCGDRSCCGVWGVPALWRGACVGSPQACLGSSQHLKDKFGQGYLLELKSLDAAGEGALKVVRSPLLGAPLALA